MVSIRAAAEAAWIHVGDVIADRAIGDSFLHVSKGVNQSIGRVARRLEEVEGKSLRAFGTDTRQALELFDQTL
jgi:hypothetical protein